jgi:glycosyltransferase involved in cell wall biosynthesis
VPVFNEAGTIPGFLADLSRQSQVSLELIISDGGSYDGSLAAVDSCRASFPFPLRVLSGPRGRAGQLNRGAEASGAPTLLFLHIDSHFPDPLALRKGLDQLQAQSGCGAPLAGRFALEFHFPDATPLPYRFYGAKAALDRPGCTHGDQGFLISAQDFRRAGPFDTGLPLMEDGFFAEAIRESGRWLLLPAAIRTSPRRFLSEGLLARQTLNAMISNLAAIGRLDLVEELRGCYRTQHAAERLELRPFFRHIKAWIAALPAQERARFWSATGSYIRGNAWQIAFFFDVVSGRFEKGKGGRLLAWHDRYLAPLLDSRAGNGAAVLLVKLWFRVMTKL